MRTASLIVFNPLQNKRLRLSVYFHIKLPATLLRAQLVYHAGIVYDTASNNVAAQAILRPNDHDEGERYGRSN
jgi:hypothetical protein